MPALEAFLSLVHASTLAHYREQHLSVMGRKSHRFDGEPQRLWDLAVLPVCHISLLNVPWSWSSLILGKRRSSHPPVSTLPMQQAWPATCRGGSFGTDVVVKVNYVLLTHRCFP